MSKGPCGRAASGPVDTSFDGSVGLVPSTRVDERAAGSSRLRLVNTGESREGTTRGSCGCLVDVRSPRNGAVEGFKFADVLAVVSKT